MRKQFSKIAFLAGVSLALAFTFGCAGSDDNNGGGGGGKGTFKDDRDGQIYGWVKIGSQVWMAKNLNYAAVGSKCGTDIDYYFIDGIGIYKLSDANTVICDTYGRLYNWPTATAGVCPSGWHLPSRVEWDTLIVAVGGVSTAGKHLKAKEGWEECGPSVSAYYYRYSCDDTYGFAALPGGVGYIGDKEYYIVDTGAWWDTNKGSYARYMSNRDESFNFAEDLDGYYISVRCLKN